MGQAFRKTLEEKITLRDTFKGVGFRVNMRKFFVEVLSGWFKSDSRKLGVYKNRLIDKRSNRYFEKIIDGETGVLLRHCEETLSQHQGRGSAKYKK